MGWDVAFYGKEKGNSFVRRQISTFSKGGELSHMGQEHNFKTGKGQCVPWGGGKRNQITKRGKFGVFCIGLPPKLLPSGGGGGSRA